MKRILIPLLVAALMCFTLIAAADGDVLAFDKSVNAVNEGETVQTVLIREGAPTEGELTYTSSDERIATVDDNGVVTGVKKGIVTISAVVKTEKKSWRASLKLTVVRPVLSLTVNTEKLPVFQASDSMVAPLLTVREDAEENTLPVLLVAVKKKIQLTVSVEPKDATSRKVTLESSDPAVFAAGSNSTITGVAPGEAILTVASETTPEVQTRLRVLVIQPVSKLTVSSSTPYVTVGGQANVFATAMPADASIPGVNWASGSEQILTVDENGVVSGLKRGNGRIIAAAMDGSKIRANFTMKVVQLPESLTVNTEALTVDVGKTAALKATVLPKDTDNKQVIWTSSDTNIATVDKNGRIKGVALGDCTVTCTSKEKESISASVSVHVQQPVTKLYFNEKEAIVYMGETAQLSWTTLPTDASNPVLTFKSGNTSAVTVDENGVVTGVGRGKKGVTQITATTTDGSKRTAKITVHSGPHVEGVQMIRKHAYLDLGQTSDAGANLFPEDAVNNHMTWESADESIATANGQTNHKMHLKGISRGTTTVTGTTEDGGFQTSILVSVGDFDKGISFRGFDFDSKGNFWLTVKNNTDFIITTITAEFECYDAAGGDNAPYPINTRDKSNKVNIVWTGRLKPGESTGKKNWKMVNYKAPSNMDDTRGIVTLINYQIDNDWVKTIRQGKRPWKEY